MAPRGNGLYIPAWVFDGEALGMGVPACLLAAGEGALLVALGEGMPECLLADEGGGLLMFVECEFI